MATFVIMPRQGQSVESCIFTQWFKKVGDEIKVGDILFAYETDKASFEEEAVQDGILLKVFCEEGDEVPVLDNIAIIGKAGENIEQMLSAGGGDAGEKTEASANPEESVETAKAEDKAEVSETPAEPVVSDEKPSPGIEGIKREEVHISPRAKRLAESKGVPFETIAGSGPNKRIIEKDIKAFISSSPTLTPMAKKILEEEGLQAGETGSGLAGAVKSADLVEKSQAGSGEFEVKKLTHIRKLIAKAMLSSLQNSAQLTHHLGADARKMLAMRKQIKETEGAPNITLNDMVCYATIKALKLFPQANAHFMGDSVKYFKNVHLGLAVDTEKGLMVPAVKNADRLSIAGLSEEFKELAISCREGNVNPDLLSSEAASFTISNLGAYGVEMFTPVINLPQVAILGVNTIVPRPADLGNGAYGFVPYIGLSLTYDHQALDGGEATRFLKQIAIEIENIEFDY